MPVSYGLRWKYFNAGGFVREITVIMVEDCTSVCIQLEYENGSSSRWSYREVCHKKWVFIFDKNVLTMCFSCSILEDI